MRISEIILDAIANTTLFEMVRSRQDAKDIVTDLSPPIVTHLIKLYVFDHAPTRNHWIKEVDGWLYKIDDLYLKPSNKKPDGQTLYDWIVFDSAPHYDAAYLNGKVKKWKMADYSGITVHDYDAEVVLNQVFKVILAATKDIAVSNKFATIADYLPAAT